MTEKTGWYASQLRRELGLRNRRWAAGRAHVESYGDPPVIVYAPEGGRHGNFFDPAYRAIAARPEWMRRFDKVHAQSRALPRTERRWRELDSSMSSDALLMNVFCTPGVTEAPAVRGMLGVEGSAGPDFGWRARVPLANGGFDRTEVDMRWGSLLLEAKLTERDFQTKAAAVVEAYRDFDAVFERERLPHVQLRIARRREPAESPEAYSQEFESLVDAQGRELGSVARLDAHNGSAASAWGSEVVAVEPAYASYQLIRNVLAAYAQGCGFCVVHDQRRPDLREAWFQVMAAVKPAPLRVRLSVLTWQELAAALPARLQAFLDLKYGIARPGKDPSALEE